MHQLDFSVFDDIVDIVFGSMASGCGEQSIALARICDVGLGGGGPGSNLANYSTGYNLFLALETLLEGIV